MSTKSYKDAPFTSTLYRQINIWLRLGDGRIAVSLEEAIQKHEEEFAWSYALEKQQSEPAK